MEEVWIWLEAHSAWLEAQERVLLVWLKVLEQEFLVEQVVSLKVEWAYLKVLVEDC